MLRNARHKFTGFPREKWRLPLSQDQWSMISDTSLEMMQNMTGLSCGSCKQIKFRNPAQENVMADVAHPHLDSDSCNDAISKLNVPKRIRNAYDGLNNYVSSGS